MCARSSDSVRRCDVSPTFPSFLFRLVLCTCCVRVSGHEVGRESMDGVYRFTVGSAKCVDDCLMDLLSSLLPHYILLGVEGEAGPPELIAVHHQG
jgi:hypothetical protein